MKLNWKPSLKNTTLSLQSDADGAMTEAAVRLLRFGVELNASDVHIEPWYPRLRFRVHGYFQDIALSLNSEQLQNLFGRLKVLARLRPWDQGIIQEGRIDGEFFSASFPVRMSVFPTINGEKIVLRYLGHGRELTDLQALGYSEKASNLIRSVLNLSGGLFLIYGSSNSGKTTAAYAVLQEISICRPQKVSIATIEDPVERNTRLFAQTDLSHRDLSYEKALRALLRQDPEVIFIGEIRDAATAEIAFQAALTGHFIVTTLHAGSLSEAILRLIGFGLDIRQIFMVLCAALALELFPANCPHCRQSLLLSAMPIPTDLMKHCQDSGLRELFQSMGCEKCNASGFSGRVPVYDLLLVTPDLRQKILEAPLDWLTLSMVRNIDRLDVLTDWFSRGIISPYEVYHEKVSRYDPS